MIHVDPGALRELLVQPPHSVLSLTSISSDIETEAQGDP